MFKRLLSSAALLVLAGAAQASTVYTLTSIDYENTFAPPGVLIPTCTGCGTGTAVDDGAGNITISGMAWEIDGNGNHYIASIDATTTLAPTMTPNTNPAIATVIASLVIIATLSRRRLRRHAEILGNRELQARCHQKRTDAAQSGEPLSDFATDGTGCAAEDCPVPQRRARMGEVTRAVRGGASLADALEDHDALTATGYNLVRVGERSGKLASMLDSLAKLYEEAGRNRMKRVLILLEPIAILVIGSMIGTIILGVILAITSANDLAV